ncbi:MAG: hypothetical protein JXB49_11835 [Bacteroidales bacterium]|nr:hypothetical protein [Bacteroidales bacterium]
MKKNLLLIICILSAFAINTYSQNRWIEKHHKGKIELNDGTVKEGYIPINYTAANDFQKDVSLLSPELYEKAKGGEKVKMKEYEKFKAKDVKYFEIEGGARYESVKYADLYAAGSASIPQMYMFEEVCGPKVKLYKKYISLEGIVSGPVITMTPEEQEEHVKTHFDLLIQKGDVNPKNISTISLLDYISDNQEVLDKFNNDEYGNLKSVFSSKVKSGNINHPDYEQDFIKLLNDYNK